MAQLVTKRNGSTEPFNISKIKSSIKATVSMTEMPDEEVSWFMEQILDSLNKFCDGKEMVTTKQIRDIIVHKLHENTHGAAKKWLAYEKKKI